MLISFVEDPSVDGINRLEEYLYTRARALNCNEARLDALFDVLSESGGRLMIELAIAAQGINCRSVFISSLSRSLPLNVATRLQWPRR